ncbi:MAG TPA: LacI family DNA-binding transcriptional regulator [Microbacterium sp.]|nr:LacI family DNA-binding transcriptional regulator [Microbacterium sp.]
MAEATGPVTIEEVAAAAGVSRSTVSRVVNGSELVRPDTVAAVQKAIAELSYVPNRAARSLASRQTMAVALVVPEDTSRFFGDPFFAAIVPGIHARLRRSNYMLNLLIANSNPGERLSGAVRGGLVDGAIIASHHTSDTFIDQIASAVPVVYGGRPVRHRPDAYVVDVDNVAAARTATAHLAQRGCRTVGTITGPLSMPAGADRLEGFRAGIAEAGLVEGPVVEGDFSIESGAGAMRSILASGSVPDGLFIASDLMAQGALTTAQGAGIRVPEQLKIVGFDDSAVATSVTPHLTTIHQPTYEQGELMAEILLELIAGGAPVRETIMRAELVVRDST